MKPSQCQKSASLSSPSDRPEEFGFDVVWSAPKRMYCEKCGFVSADSEKFKRHMMEKHWATRFYCFYCNHVSFSETELKSHLGKHTMAYPLRCNICGHGYMRKHFLEKHIQQVHSECVALKPSQPIVTQQTPDPFSSALSQAPNRLHTPPEQAPAQVTALHTNKQSKNNKVKQGVKVAAGNKVPKVDSEMLSPLNEPIQHNRSLTVSLPEEVSIPAGCLVELIEIKTVNGKKELKLRLVSQQPNGSPVKDLGAPNTIPGKPSSSTLETSPIKETPRTKETCITKRTLQETMNLNVERPTVVPLPTKIADQSKSTQKHRSNGKYANKRKTQETNNTSVLPARNVNQLKNTLEDLHVTVKDEPKEINSQTNNVPIESPEKKKKVVGDMLYCVGENVETLKLSCVVPRVYTNPDCQASLSSQKEEVSADASGLRSSVKCSSPVNTSLAQQKSKVGVSGYVMEKKTSDSTMSEKSLKGDLSESEMFPVISHVFSLSQHSKDIQGYPQPLVVALQGIAMGRSATSVNTFQVNDRKTPTENVTDIRPTFLTTNEPPVIQNTVDLVLGVIQKPDIRSQHTQTLNENPMDYKIDKDKDNKKAVLTCSEDCVSNVLKSTAASETCLTNQDKTDNLIGHKETKRACQKDASVAQETTDPAKRSKANEPATSTRSLTISLKRIRIEEPCIPRNEQPGVEQCGKVWRKQDPKRRKPDKVLMSQTQILAFSDAGVVLYPTPLKVDQLVKLPGPSQPVVVLNHPKPHALNNHKGMGTSPGIVQKCQIMKMRLRKVVGQKYEVSGCTVRLNTHDNGASFY